jgi:hypothetical protein
VHWQELALKSSLYTNCQLQKDNSCHPIGFGACSSFGLSLLIAMTASSSYKYQTRGLVIPLAFVAGNRALIYASSATQWNCDRILLAAFPRKHFETSKDTNYEA